MKNTTTKIFLVTFFGLIASNITFASEEDYNFYAKVEMPAIHIGGTEIPSYDGAEADFFTFDSSIYSAIEYQKASVSDGHSQHGNTINPLHSMTNK